MDSCIENIGPNYGTDPRNSILDKNICISKEETEAFLALMQLRQLRKAWVDDWEPYPFKSYSAISTIVNDGKIVV